MKTFFYGLSVALLCLSTSAQATGPRVTSSLFEAPVNEIFALDFPLVLSADAPEGGLAAAIIKAAFKAENVENTITPLPLQTMLSYYLNEENALAVVGEDLNFSASEAKNVILVPVLNLKESYFYYRPKHQTLEWKGNLAAFKGLTLGIHKSDVSNMGAYQKAGIKVEQERLDVRLKALIESKIDVLRDTNVAVDVTLKKDFAAQQQNIIQLEPNAGEALISVAFNKKNPQGAALAKQFQQGLAKLIASGEYKNILKTHLGEQNEKYVTPLK